MESFALIVATSVSVLGYLRIRRIPDVEVVREERLALSKFPPTKNDLLLRAARKQKTERVPVWMMRQAGRF